MGSMSVLSRSICDISTACWVVGRHVRCKADVRLLNTLTRWRRSRSRDSLSWWSKYPGATGRQRDGGDDRRILVGVHEKIQSVETNKTTKILLVQRDVITCSQIRERYPYV
jgi:hypothetical protein